MGELIVGVVGPCAAGKTSLIRALCQRGLMAKHIAQEHSYVPDMWKRLTNPDILIYLDVSYPLTIKRRSLSWSEEEYKEQLKRLEHAKENASIYINTDNLTIDEVLDKALNYLDKTSFL